MDHESPLSIHDNSLAEINFTGFNDRSNLDVSYISDPNNFDEQNRANEENLEKDYFRMSIVALKLIFTEDHDVDYMGDIEEEELYT